MNHITDEFLRAMWLAGKLGYQHMTEKSSQDCATEACEHSSVSHTPGPWEVKSEEAGASYIRVRGTALGYRFKLANVLIPTYEDYQPPQEFTKRELEETRANARLIAAAPDLLQALKASKSVIADLLGEWACDPSWSAAIAKAEGLDESKG